MRRGIALVAMLAAGCGASGGSDREGSGGSGGSGYGGGGGGDAWGPGVAVGVPEQASFDVVVDLVSSWRNESLPITMAIQRGEGEQVRVWLGFDAVDDGRVIGTSVQVGGLAWKPRDTYWDRLYLDFDRLELRFYDDDGDGTVDRLVGNGHGRLETLRPGGEDPVRGEVDFHISGHADRRAPEAVLAGPGSLAPLWGPTLRFDEPVRPDGRIRLLADGVRVPVETSWDPNGGSATITPAIPLPWGAHIETRLEGLTDLAGNVAPPRSWSGEVIPLPGESPIPDFAVGIDGFHASGVVATRGTGLPSDGDAAGALAFDAQPWGLLFEAEVPAEGSPRLRFDAAWLPDGSGVPVEVIVHGGNVRLREILAPVAGELPLDPPVFVEGGQPRTPWHTSGYVDTISEAAHFELDLTPMRGERAVIRIAGGEDQSTPYPFAQPLPLRAVFLDGLRIDTD